MKQKKQEGVENQQEKKREKEQHEIHKAVAQIWHSHFTNARVATSEFDARRRNFHGKPSRFKLEAMNKLHKAEVDTDNANWNFTHSLWDSYEIVAVSRRLETGLVLDYDFDDNKRVLSKRREGKNSLRNLFNMKSSRRFNDVEISHRRSM